MEGSDGRCLGERSPLGENAVGSRSHRNAGIGRTKVLYTFDDAPRSLLCSAYRIRAQIAKSEKWAKNLLLWPKTDFSEHIEHHQIMKLLIF